MRNSPCKNCSDRVVGCHDTCDKYKQFKQEVTQYREAKEKQRIGETLDINRSIRTREYKRKHIRARK